MRHLSTVLLIGSMVLLPLLIWVEQTNAEVWQNRLAIPFFTEEPDRHTPVHFAGTFLPSAINNDLTLTPTDNPILLTTTTRISPNATLTLAPGTTVYAHEFAGIIVAGQLIAQGSTKQPIQFFSNEAHPLNQTWGGITVVKDGQAVIKHAAFHHASPALTCLIDGQAALTDSHISNTALGVFTMSPACRISRSRINSTRDGIVAVNTEPAVLSTEISAARTDIVKKNY